mgnify:CR=1 FL=1
MRIVITTDGGTRKNAHKQVEKSEFGYAFASLILIAAIIIPGISNWVQSQPLVVALQDLVQIPIAGNVSKKVSTLRFVFPTLKGILVTSEFGWRLHPITGERKLHTGIDFGAQFGTPIYAVAGGKVEFSGEKGGYGNAVIIEHNDNLSTLYAHVSKLYVNEGASVAPGQLIALVGSTGFSTGPHLHFEVRINDKPVNPRPYLQQYLAKR